VLEPTPEQRPPDAPLLGEGPPSIEDRRLRPRILAVERVAAAFEVILCSGFPTQFIIVSVLTTFGMRARLANGSLSPHFVFALTLIDTLLLVGFVCFFLRAHRESIRGTLFGWRPARDVVVGLLLIPASFLVVLAVLLIVQIVAPSLHNVPHNPLQDLADTRLDAILLAFTVMIAGGIREEIQRGFVLRRFEQYLGGGTVGIIVFSVLFGLGHIEQGYDVSVATAVLGAFWGVIYLRRRSVIGPMIGHAGFNLAQVLKLITVGA
jgi:membrane protease YdiL (CAAX protease family)